MTYEIVRQGLLMKMTCGAAFAQVWLLAQGVSMEEATKVTGVLA